MKKLQQNNANPFNITYKPADNLLAQFNIKDEMKKF